MKVVSINNLAIVYLGGGGGGNAYRINVTFMSLNEATNFIKSSAISNRRGVL